MQKYKSLFRQAEELDTNEAYKERDDIYKSMTFEEIINLINDVSEIAELIATNSYEFKLDAIEIGAIGKELKKLEKVGDCLDTISLIRNIKGR